MSGYLLADFASLFEVAVGINLVFSVWDSLRNQAVAKFDVISQDLEKSMAATMGQSYSTSRVATEYSIKHTTYIKRMKLLSTIGKIIGLTATVGLVFLLIYLGFQPLTRIEAPTVLGIIFFSVGISPLFLAVGNIYARHCKNRLQYFQQQHTKVLLDLQDCLTN